MLIIEGLTRRFGDRRPWTRLPRHPPRQLRRRDRPLRRRQVDAAAHDQPPRRADATAASCSTASTSPRCAAASCAHWRARCAMIFQQFNLVGRLDVLTNVLMGRLAEVPPGRSLLSCGPRAKGAGAVGARAVRHGATSPAQRADQLSGGQQQRVAIARALVQEPDIILADEPIASLDPRNTRIVMDALLRINKHFGITVLCNLHSLDLARNYCDRLVGMAAGRVVFDGAPADADRACRARALRSRGRRGRSMPAACRRGARPSRRPLPRRLIRRRRSAHRSASDSQPHQEIPMIEPSIPRRRRRARLRSPSRRGAGLEGEVSGTDLRGHPGRERLGRHRALGAVRSPICRRNSA